MKRKFWLYIVLGNALTIWVALGAFAAFWLHGQVAWFAVSLAVLLGAATEFIADARLLRSMGELLHRHAESMIEQWPHVIATLDDLIRIEPERAEMLEVAKLEMVAGLEQARRIAAEQSPSWWELFKPRKAGKA